MALSIIRLVATYHVENFGCRATQADGAAIERQLLDRGLHARRLRQRSRSRRSQHLHRDRLRRSGRPRRHPPHSSRKSRRADPGYRLLRAARSAGNCGNSGRRASSSAIRTNTSWPTMFRPLATSGHSCRWRSLARDSTECHRRRHLRAHRTDGSAGLRRRAVCRQDASQSEGPGRLQQSLLVLHHSLRPRAKPLAEAGAGAARSRCRWSASGYREIVLSGINLGRWGRELTPRTNFASMLRAILESTQIEKLRISSVEPMDWTNEVIELVASSPRICKHAHVPLQSGSDKILRTHASQVSPVALRRSHRAHSAARCPMLRLAPT